MTVGRNQKVLIDPWVIEVMTNGSQDCTHCLHGCQVRSYCRLLNEAVHRLSHVSSMNTVVVRIGVVVSLFEQACQKQMKRISNSVPFISFYTCYSIMLCLSPCVRQFCIEEEQFSQRYCVCLPEKDMKEYTSIMTHKRCSTKRNEEGKKKQEIKGKGQRVRDMVLCRSKEGKKGNLRKAVERQDIPSQECYQSL